MLTIHELYLQSVSISSLRKEQGEKPSGFGVSTNKYWHDIPEFDSVAAFEKQTIEFYCSAPTYRGL